MIVRLSVLTAAMALFALGFSSLVAMERSSVGSVMASGDCRDGGLVCAPRPPARGPLIASEREFPAPVPVR